jgi:hypothetical protein
VERAGRIKAALKEAVKARRWATFSSRAVYSVRSVGASSQCQGRQGAAARGVEAVRGEAQTA